MKRFQEKSRRVKGEEQGVGVRGKEWEEKEEENDFILVVSFYSVL